MNVVFFGYGMLELGGGFEHYLIDTASTLKAQYPNTNISILTSSSRLTERYYNFLSKITRSRFDPKSLHREQTANIRKTLQGVEYVQFDSIVDLNKKIASADIIYTKNELIELYLLKNLKAEKRIPYVVGIHTPIYYPFTPTLGSKLHNVVYTSFVYKHLLRKAAAIKVNNKDDHKYIKTKFGFNNVGVLHHGFEIQEIQANADSDNKMLSVLFAGRLTEQKGLDILAEVIEMVGASDTAQFIQFKVAGVGSNEDNKVAQKLSETYSNVEYLGHVGKGDMGELYRWCDIAMIPSKFETLNKIAVEAATHGKIAVSSDIPGPREVIDNNVTGFLVDVRSRCFYEKLVYLQKLKVEDVSKFQAIGTKAKEKIKKEFNIHDTNLILYKTFEFLGESN